MDVNEKVDLKDNVDNEYELFAVEEVTFSNSDC